MTLSAFEPENWLLCHSAIITTAIIIIIIIIIIRYGCLLSQAFLNQRWSPPLTLHASHCSTFRIMCDVPSIVAFCSESIEFFPGAGSKFFLKLLVTIPVAPIITGIIVHFRFHIRCTSIHKLLYFNVLLLLLLSSSSSSSSSSPLCRVFILIFLRQTTSLGNTVLQLFCCYYSWCLYR